MSAESTETEEKQSGRKAIIVPLSERLAYSIPEFAACCGKGRVWGYRQVYLGRINVVSPDHGEMMVPKSEVEAFLGRAAKFDPKPDQPRRGRKPKTQPLLVQQPAMS